MDARDRTIAALLTVAVLLGAVGTWLLTHRAGWALLVGAGALAAIAVLVNGIGEALPPEWIEGAEEVRDGEPPDEVSVQVKSPFPQAQRVVPMGDRPRVRRHRFAGRSRS